MRLGKTKIKPGDKVLLSTSHGSVEVTVLHLLPVRRLTVVNNRGLAGVRKIMKKLDKAWLDITLEDIVKARVPLDIRYVRESAVKHLENKG